MRLGGTYIEGLTLQQEAEAYDTALSGASKVASLNFSGGSYVRAHLLRKHLIRLDYQSDSLKHQARGLSHCQLLSLKLPDEMDYLAEVPACIRAQWALGHAFNCYPLFISCFACLARAPLRQHHRLWLTQRTQRTGKQFETLWTHTEQLTATIPAQNGFSRSCWEKKNWTRRLRSAPPTQISRRLSSQSCQNQQV